MLLVPTFVDAIRYVEFFSGIGGWRYALESVLVAKNVCCSHSHRHLRSYCAAALDHSDLCNSVYRHNFGDDSIRSSRRIEHIQVSDVHQWNANLWMMSPPCQPHTRQHDKTNDLQDPRSNAFLHILQLLSELPENDRPTLILIENVVGFETSDSHQKLRHTLASTGYHIAQFVLQPTQVHIPNDRPRYYGVAIPNQALSMKSDVAHYFRSTTTTTENHAIPIHTSIPELGVEAIVSETDLPTLAKYLDDENSHSQPCENHHHHHDKLRLSEKDLQKSAAWCLDIVDPHSRRTSCFTSSYGRYMKGTGSVLLETTTDETKKKEKKDSTNNSLAMAVKLLPPEERQYCADWWRRITEHDPNAYLRYFSGSELARLFGFPQSHFSFPEDHVVSQKQQWKLMGNSLNVVVASKLIELGLWAIGGLEEMDPPNGIEHSINPPL
jgi:tRNA (cytosine38-C5)-methyltransferase